MPAAHAPSSQCRADDRAGRRLLCGGGSSCCSQVVDAGCLLLLRLLAVLRSVLLRVCHELHLLLKRHTLFLQPLHFLALLGLGCCCFSSCSRCSLSHPGFHLLPLPFLFLPLESRCLRELLLTPLQLQGASVGDQLLLLQLMSTQLALALPFYRATIFKFLLSGAFLRHGMGHGRRCAGEGAADLQPQQLRRRRATVPGCSWSSVAGQVGACRYAADQ